MRLNKYETRVLKTTFKKFDPDAKIYLYGSRVDDTKKGGDIDLLIFSEHLQQKDASEIREFLWEKLGEQKIDILIVKNTTHPFTRLALKESVPL
ncbi:MAG: nucleotidyltransferase domain-containing protein [Desulfotomaculum sp.]|nr:nucleotidyltransferase domain-containing protein [Desulfotomaculum sp.]